MTATAKSAPPPASRFWISIAFLWGLAEATCFFIVPDVYTSRLVLTNPRRGFQACLVALVGAVLGGSTVFWAVHHASLAVILTNCFVHLPGISPALIDAAELSLQSHGLLALFIGAASGVPYKLFALHAGQAGINFAGFVAASIAARLLRFVAATGFVWSIGRFVLRNLSASNKLRIHIVAWSLFYGTYFWLMAK